MKSRRARAGDAAWFLGIVFGLGVVVLVAGYVASAIAVYLLINR